MSTSGTNVTSGNVNWPTYSEAVWIDSAMGYKNYKFQCERCHQSIIFPSYTNIPPSIVYCSCGGMATLVPDTPDKPKSTKPRKGRLIGGVPIQ